MKFDYTTNLYDEIVEDLGYHDKTIKDIKWISTLINEEIVKIDIDNFLEVAKGYTYDRGWGGVEVPLDLTIVGEGWWMERHEYDGMEGFSFKTRPEEPKETIKITKIPEDFGAYELKEWQ